MSNEKTPTLQESVGNAKAQITLAIDNLNDLTKQAINGLYIQLERQLKVNEVLQKELEKKTEESKKEVKKEDEDKKE